MILPLIITLIAIIFVFLTLKKTKKIRKKYSDFLSFLFTIIATFLGVFLAISINNQSIKEQHQNTTIKLLKASVEELKLIEVESDLNLANISKSENLKQKLINNKFPYPSIFPRLMKNDLILENISSRSLRALNHSWRNLITIHNTISNTNEIMVRSNKNIKELSIMYNMNLIFSKKLLLNEIQFINGDITKDELIHNVDIEYDNLNKSW